MPIKPTQYETLLSTLTDHQGALALLKLHRPYLESVPSMRRPQDSIVPLPLPNVRVREGVYINGLAAQVAAGAAINLPCDLALLMCDPEWKIKTGVEIFVYLHRPQEDFSQLLLRWRHTQLLLDQGYEWLLPAAHRHLLNDGAEVMRPLFVLFPESPVHIAKGLRGASLPTVILPEPETPLEEPEAPRDTARDLGLDGIAELDNIDTSGLEIPDSED